MKEKVTFEAINTVQEEAKIQHRIGQYKDLGLKIAYYRKRKGLTQIELAEQVDKSRTYISRIEAPKAEINPTMDVIFDIADALEIPTHLLFDNEKI